MPLYIVTTSPASLCRLNLFLSPGNLVRLGSLGRCPFRPVCGQFPGHVLTRAASDVLLRHLYTIRILLDFDLLPHLLAPHLPKAFGYLKVLLLFTRASFQLFHF